LAIAKTTGSPVEKLRIEVMGDKTFVGMDVAAGSEVDAAELPTANDWVMNVVPFAMACILV
jgi:hypothetical protein